MTETRSPLKDRPLRTPGQSVRGQRIDLVFDKLMGPVVVALMLVTVMLIEWIRYLWPAGHAPWMQSIVALAALSYGAFQVRRSWPKVRALKLAEEGEKFVGQFLEGLREKGYRVYHDIVADDFNVDHVLIGPAGVFTIETKTWSKPKQGKAEIHFDGETLKAAGRMPDRDPVGQARAQASWLKGLLTESTGKSIPVRPVVLFPGWFVNDSRKNRGDLWVMEPKMLPAWLDREKVVLADEEMSMAGEHLSRYIRFQDRLLEKTS